MNIIHFTEEEGGKEAWMNWRLGKATGSRVKDIGLSKTGVPKIENYRMLAESIIGSQALIDDDAMTSIEAMNRGTRLEKEGIERFRKETGKKVDDSLIGWEREDDPRIAISPDGVIGKTGATEVKCLSAARHIQAFITKKIPSEYWEQSLQYFVTNDSLRSLFFIFYDPRYPTGLDFFYVEIKRKDVINEVNELLNQERDALKWVRENIVYLTQFIRIQPQADVVHAEAVVVEETSAEKAMSELGHITLEV